MQAISLSPPPHLIHLPKFPAFTVKRSCPFCSLSRFMHDCFASSLLSKVTVSHLPNYEVSPVGMSGMWLASPLLGLLTLLQAMHHLELWISANLQVIQHIQCPSAEYGSCPFFSSASVSIRSNHCMNWVHRGTDTS